jgi:hypothetical protein
MHRKYHRNRARHADLSAEVASWGIATVDSFEALALYVTRFDPGYGWMRNQGQREAQAAGYRYGTGPYGHGAYGGGAEKSDFQD